jgi:hypothetical protein
VYILIEKDCIVKEKETKNSTFVFDQDVFNQVESE